jgi:hypothetical protein
MEKEEHLLSLVRQHCTLLLRLRNHITHYNTKLSLDSELQQVTDLWLSDFVAYNNEVRDAGNVSLGDLLFVIRCHILVAQSGCITPSTQLGHLHQLSVCMQLWSCHHVADLPLHFTWPGNSDVLQDIEKRIAEMVVYHLSHDVGAAADATPLPKKYSDAVALVKSFGTAKRWNEPEEDYKKRRAPEYGVYWAASPLDEIRDFVPLCGRVLYRVHTDQRLLNRYPHHVLRKNPVTDGMRQGMLGWLADKVLIQLSDSFVRTYRSICFESWIPLAGRLIASRKAGGNKEDGLTALENILGVDTAAYLQSHVEVPLPTSGQIQFIGSCCFLHYDIDNIQQAVATTKTHVVLDRPPIIVQLRKQWFIHNIKPRAQYIPCKDITEALLLWCLMVKKQYDCMIGNYVGIERFINNFV